MYLIEKSSAKKMMYLKEHFDNPMDLPFLDLFKKMYLGGIQFAIENPKMVLMFGHLLSKKGDIYNKVFKENLSIAVNLYKTMIDRDKALGRLKPEIDSTVFAQLVIDLTMNVAVNEISGDSKEFNFDNMYERITQIINIIENGVIVGD